MLMQRTRDLGGRKMGGHRFACIAGGGAAAIATVLAVVLASSAAAVNSGLSDAKSHLPEGQILRIALTAAGRSGDPKPTLIQHTRGNQASYLIAERGHFTAYMASPPPGAPLPTGSVLTLVVDAFTGDVTDYGVSNRYPDLVVLGPVTTDLRIPSVPSGVLTGAIILIGGPSPPPGEKRKPAAGLVSVFGARGRLIARQHVRAGHLFRFRLPPGRYELRDATYWDCPAATAIVRAGHVTRVEVDYGCGVP